MSTDSLSALAAAAVPGLTRSDPHEPGITRERISGRFRYRDPSGTEVTSPETVHRIGALGIPPAWKDVWISPDPLGHIQATGVDGRGRTQYRYHQVWREQRDAQKFVHMLRFASALPGLRSAVVADLGGRHLDRERVTAAAVRLIDLGLFRIGGEKYAELDHHYGATTLQRHDVTVMRDGVAFDYIAKEGKRRTITVTDDAVRSVVRALLRSESTSDYLFSFRDKDAWRPLRSHQVSTYIATRAGGHFTAKEFRTWNATVLMALLLANAEPAPSARSRKSAVTAAVRGVADWLGDTPAVARASYIDPRVMERYTSDGQLAAVPRMPALLPAPAEAEIAVAALLADDTLSSLPDFTGKRGSVAGPAGSAGTGGMNLSAHPGDDGPELLRRGAAQHVVGEAETLPSLEDLGGDVVGGADQDLRGRADLLGGQVGMDGGYPLGSGPGVLGEDHLGPGPDHELVGPLAGVAAQPPEEGLGGGRLGQHQLARRELDLRYRRDRGDDEAIGLLGGEPQGAIGGAGDQEARPGPRIRARCRGRRRTVSPPPRWPGAARTGRPGCPG